MTKVNFYCPACGEDGEIEFLGLSPGTNRYICPNCGTVFDVSIDFYEVEVAEGGG